MIKIRLWPITLVFGVYATHRCMQCDMPLWKSVDRHTTTDTLDRPVTVCLDCLEWLMPWSKNEIRTRNH